MQSGIVHVATVVLDSRLTLSDALDGGELLEDVGSDWLNQELAIPFSALER